MVRHLFAVLIAGGIGHIALLGAVLGLDLGGAYCAFAATAIEFSLVTATLVGVSADGLAQALLVALGPFFAPVLPAILILALVSLAARRGGVIFQVTTAVFLCVLPIAARLSQPGYGGPAIEPEDIALVCAVGAVAGFLYWLIAGHRIARRQAASSG